MFSFSSRHSVACFLCLSIVGCLSIVLAAPAASGQQQQSEEMQIIRAAEQMVNAQQADQIWGVQKDKAPAPVLNGAEGPGT